MTPETRGHPVVVGVFDRESSAREVIDAVRRLGLTDQQYGLLVPGQHLNMSETTAQDTSAMLAAATAAEGAHSDVASVLLSMGVPDGEARFYAHEFEAGRALVVVQSDGRADQVRQLLLDRGGFDVQSRGADFVRGGQHGVSDGVGARPADLTYAWEDVRSRYEMLWQQHYGTTDATWESVEPIYRYAWEIANDTRYRGRPWSDVEMAVRREWSGSRLSQKVTWRDASGPLQDVWADVAEEVAMGAEGGEARIIPRQGSDQTVAARDILPPR